MLTSEVWGSISGGPENWGWWNSPLRFGVERDSEKFGGMTLQANTQLFFNPAANPNAGFCETALIIGLRGEITF